MSSTWLEKMPKLTLSTAETSMRNFSRISDHVDRVSAVAEINTDRRESTPRHASMHRAAYISAVDKSESPAQRATCLASVADVSRTHVNKQSCLSTTGRLADRYSHAYCTWPWRSPLAVQPLQILFGAEHVHVTVLGEDFKCHGW